MNARVLLMAGRVLKLAAGSDGRPVSGATDAHLAAINAMPGVLTTLTAADVFVRECVAINDKPLKNGLRLGAEELAAIARLSPGSGIHRNHDTWTGSAGLPDGRIFAARVEGSEVIQTFYILATDEGIDLVRKIDGGAITEVSVSFGYDRLECSICQKVIETGWDSPPHEHWPLVEYKLGTCYWMVRGVTEYFETSLVWQGMANETRIRMAAARCLSADADLAEFFAGKPRMAGSLRPGFVRLDLPEHCRAMLLDAPESGMGYHEVVATFSDGRTLDCEAVGGEYLIVPEAYAACTVVAISLSLAAMFTPRPLDTLFTPDVPIGSLFTQ